MYSCFRLEHFVHCFVAVLEIRPLGGIKRCAPSCEVAAAMPLGFNLTVVYSKGKIADALENWSGFGRELLTPYYEKIAIFPLRVLPVETTGLCLCYLYRRSKAIAVRSRTGTAEIDLRRKTKCKRYARTNLRSRF
jgi:hypothetical protein